jgi:hypothetical protein
MPAHQGVSMTPGETALTRSGASSTESGGTIASSAPLAAARATVPGNAARADAAETIVTEPSAQPGECRLDRLDVREELAVERLPERGLVQVGDRAGAHRARAGGEHQVIDRSCRGEERVERPAVRRV